MPRGNDAEAASHELADRFGEGVGNAEELIDANLAMHTPALRAAELLPRDEEATREALAHIDELEGPNGEPVVDVAVRGSLASTNRYTVVVYRTAAGRDLLHVIEDDENAKHREARGKAAAKSASKSSKAKGRGKRTGADHAPSSSVGGAAAGDEGESGDGEADGGTSD